MTSTVTNSTPKNENLQILTDNPTLQSLEFIKLKIPNLIPIDLIESVKGRTFTPQQFITYQEAQIDNPANFLYVLVDPQKKIKGYLWAELNILDHSLFINTFSIDKDYWGNGTAMKKAIDFVAHLKEKTKAPLVFWISTNEKFFVKHGFKKSKNVLNIRIQLF